MTAPEHCPNCGVERETLRDKFCRKCGSAWAVVDSKAPKPGGVSGGGMKTRTKVLLGIGGAIVVLAIIGAIAGGSSGNKESSPKSTSASTSANAPATSAPAAAKPTAAPTYKFRVTRLACETDSLNTRTCTGTVTNISDKAITDARPVVHWTGGTDSDLGQIAINPVLPGQTSDFTVYTLNSNPALNSYTIGFKKIFGKESDFPVEPLAP